MNDRTNQYPPAQILDTLAELNATQARHLAVDLDERGLDAVIHSAVFNSRYPKEPK